MGSWFQKTTKGGRRLIGKLSVNTTGLFGFGNVIHRFRGLVFSLPSTDSGEYISLGAFTDARGTAETVTDFEANTITIPAGIPLREGCRVVQNLVTAPTNNTGASWTVSAGASVTEKTFTPDSQNDSLYEDITTVAGQSYRVSFDAYSITGNTTGLVFLHTNSASGNSTALTITTEKTRYSVLFTGRTGGGDVSVGIQDTNTSGFGEIHSTNWLIEDVTAQANQNPSTFTASFSYSDYENGNTVSSNVVTHAIGQPIADAYWLHDNTKSTAMREPFTTFPQDEGTARFLFSPQFNKGDVVSDNGVSIGDWVGGLLYFGGLGKLVATDWTNYPGLPTVTYSTGDEIEVVTHWGQGTFNITAQNITTASGWVTRTELDYDGSFLSDDIMHIFEGLSASVKVWKTDIWDKKYTQSEIEAGL